MALGVSENIGRLALNRFREGKFKIVRVFSRKTKNGNEMSDAALLFVPERTVRCVAFLSGEREGKGVHRGDRDFSLLFVRSMR